MTENLYGHYAKATVKPPGIDGGGVNWTFNNPALFQAGWKANFLDRNVVQSIRCLFQWLCQVKFFFGLGLGSVFMWATSSWTLFVTVGHDGTYWVVELSYRMIYTNCGMLPKILKSSLYIMTTMHVKSVLTPVDHIDIVAMFRVGSWNTVLLCSRLQVL